MDALLEHQSLIVNCRNKDGYTPIAFASYFGCYKAVCEILKRDDVDVNSIEGRMDEDYHDNKIPPSKRSRSQTLAHLLDPNNQSIWEVLYPYVRTSLILASWQGKFKVVCELLKHDKVDVNIGVEYGYTPLILASCFGRYKVVCELLKHESVDVNFAVECGYTPLTLASRMEHWDVVWELIKHDKVDLNVQCKRGYTLLMWASLKGKIDVVSELLKRGNLDPDLKNIAGLTALDVARNCELTDIREFLF